MSACRCGWDGQDAHPCHAYNYTCRAPATQRFYQPRFVSLAGMQMKVEVKDTWACDAHWQEFLATFDDAKEMPRP